MKKYIRQSLLNELLQSINTKQNLIQAIVGPRQVGKTTLVLQLFRKWKGPKLYESADELSTPNTEWISTQWNKIRDKSANKKSKSLLILDEVHKIPRWSEAVKKLFDEASKKKSRGVVKLVARPEFNFIFMSSNELLAKNIEHPKLSELIEIIKREKSERPNSKFIVFTQFRDTADYISKEINKIKDINAEIFVGQAKKSGSGLSQKEQKKIIENFSTGKINVLCATSIGEEGLDIPEVNAVIFYEPIPSAIRAIQRAGRTARLMPGKLIMLITKKTRDEAFYYVSRSREKKMHQAISKIKEGLSKDKILKIKQETL